jgi:hypothetical protein
VLAALFRGLGGGPGGSPRGSDAANGRVDIAIARTGDQTGAAGAGLLGALLFDALSPGSSAISVTGVASAPDGSAIPLTFAPVTVVVR